MDRGDHLPGFVSSWKLATLVELPYKTTVLAGRVDVGDSGVRLLGVFWLLTALTCVAAGAAVVLQMAWALRLVAFTVVASLLLCVIGWPDARTGVAVNIALLVLLAVGARRF